MTHDSEDYVDGFKEAIRVMTEGTPEERAYAVARANR